MKVAYDDRYLYVLVRMYDPHPDSIRAFLSRRDVSTPSDRVKIMIDSYHDRRTGYELAVNPKGVKSDFYTFNDSEGGSVVGRRVGCRDRPSTRSAGSPSIAFPSARCAFRAARATCSGFGVVRDIARLNERDSWPLIRRDRAGIASQLGELDGHRGARHAAPSRGDAVRGDEERHDHDHPSLVYGRQQQLTGGADLKYGVTSNLTLDATVNPDFGQVEADPAVLNLSAFETFYPEKRPFFIEGTGIFRFDLQCHQGCLQRSLLLTAHWPRSRDH